MPHAWRKEGVARHLFSEQSLVLPKFQDFLQPLGVPNLGLVFIGSGASSHLRSSARLLCEPHGPGLALIDQGGGVFSVFFPFFFVVFFRPSGQASKQASKQASQQASKENKQRYQQASNQASKQTSKQASKRASGPASKQASKQASPPPLGLRPPPNPPAFLS